MKRFAAAAMMLALPFAALAQQWKVDPAHSALTFTGTYQGEKFEGRFKRFDAKIDYDPAQLTNAKFDVTIDIAGVDTANTERDQVLPGKDF
ncbi:MAG: polyisoprenoid-binding protein, partial [Rhodanobacteraceae bacterium]